MTTFDDRGVPLSADAAGDMTLAEVRAAVVQVAAHLELVSVDEFLDEIARPDNTTEILSDLGVDIYSEFISHLFPEHRLRDVPVESWSSLDGVALVVFDIYQNGAAHGSADS